MSQNSDAKFAEQFVTREDTVSIEAVKAVSNFTIDRSEKC